MPCVRHARCQHLHSLECIRRCSCKRCRHSRHVKTSSDGSSCQWCMYIVMASTGVDTVPECILNRYSAHPQRWHRCHRTFALALNAQSEATRMWQLRTGICHNVSGHSPCMHCSSTLQQHCQQWSATVVSAQSCDRDAAL